MSDRHEEFECYECGRLKTRIIWQGRCVTCAVRRLEFNLEENDTLRYENAALEARVADQSAYILRLRKAIIDATNNAAPLDSGKWIYGIDDSVLQWPEALKEPANDQ